MEAAAEFGDGGDRRRHQPSRGSVTAPDDSNFTVRDGAAFALIGLQTGKMMLSDQLLAGVVVLSIVGLLINRVLTRVEQRLLRWRSA